MQLAPAQQRREMGDGGGRITLTPLSPQKVLNNMIRKLLSALGRAIVRLFADPAPDEPQGTTDALNYYEDQITRLSLAWLAARSGHPSEFGYLSQAEIVTAFEQEISSYQKHLRVLRARVEFAQSTYLNPAKETEREGGRCDGLSKTQELPSTRPPICDRFDPVADARQQLALKHLHERSNRAEHSLSLPGAQ